MKKKTRKQIGIENFGKSQNDNIVSDYISYLHWGLKHPLNQTDDTFTRLFTCMWSFHANMEDSEKDGMLKSQKLDLYNTFFSNTKDDFIKELDLHQDLTTKQKSDLIQCYDTTYKMLIKKFVSEEFGNDIYKFLNWIKN